MKYHLLIALPALLLAACASTLPADPAKMDAAQIKAWAADNKGLAVCINGKTAAGNVTSTYVSLDQVKAIEGSVTVETDCRIVMSSSGKAASAPK